MTVGYSITSWFMKTELQCTVGYEPYSTVPELKTLNKTNISYS